MRIGVLLATVVTMSGCQTQKYKHELMNDGKTWHLIVKDHRCEFMSDEQCMQHLREELGPQAQETCGATPFRLFQCRIKRSRHKGECLFRCEEAKARPTKPKMVTSDEFDEFQ